MYDFIVNHQLNILLAMCGACGICAFFTYVSKSLSGYKKRDLILVNLAATGLLLFDRGATIFDGQPGEVAFWMVRICNLAVYLLTLLVIFFFNIYLTDVFSENDDILVVPKMLRLTGILCFVGIGFVIMSQFIGLYYTFDVNNTYHRSSLFFLSYVFPLIVPLLQISFIVSYYKKLHRGVRLSLLMFPLVPMVASFLQFALYGLMLTDMALSFAAIQLYMLALMDTNKTLEQAHKKEMDIVLDEEKTVFRLFRQIVTAFVSAIDAKDSYTRGHAMRAAGYARQLAVLSGKDEETCEAAYFSALLHDVGKISLSDSLLKKRGNMTEEEHRLFDEHVMNGRDILSGITEYPYLQDAAHYHHERYDGTGFPEGLRGNDIPELARIVTMADAYDVMSSIRPDRDPLPQQTIREEIVKETGKRFDPYYARQMLRMIDEDRDYKLRERYEEETDEPETELVCDDYRSCCSRGIPVTDEMVRITFCYEPTVHEQSEGVFSAPSIILFDSLDGGIHRNERSIEINRYTEFGEIWFDGNMICTRAKNMKMNHPMDPTGQDSRGEPGSVTKILPGEYRIEAVRVRDHMRVRLGVDQNSEENSSYEVIVALPASSGTAYISLTGEHCVLSDIRYYTTGLVVRERDIPRIADEVSYTDRMVADLPNIQVDSYFSAVTDGIPVRDGLELVFHTMTLPTANLVWNCPFLVFFKSDNHLVHGPNYEELVIVRLDGESATSGGSARSITEMHEDESFENWDKWKEINKKGFECRVMFRRFGNRVTMSTANAGITVKSTVYLEDSGEDVCVAITGDQVAITDIRKND